MRRGIGMMYDVNAFERDKRKGRITVLEPRVLANVEWSKGKVRNDCALDC